MQTVSSEEQIRFMSVAVVECDRWALAIEINIDDLAAHVKCGCLDGALLEVVV